MSDEGYNVHMVADIIERSLNAKGRGAATRLALDLGVTPQTVSKWRKGDTLPRMETWRPIEEALGLEPDTFRKAVLGPTQPADTVVSRAEVDDLTARLAAIEAALARRNPGPAKR